VFLRHVCAAARWASLAAVALGGGGVGPALAAQPPLVVAVDGVLCDLSKTLAGPQLRVQCLIPAGVDPHQVVLKPSDRAALAAARLVLINGYGLTPALAASVTGSGWLAVAEKAVPQSEGRDPHVWHDPTQLRAMARTVAAALSRVDPAASRLIQQRSSAVSAVLSDLEGWSAAQVRTVPEVSRVLVTEHRAFAALARRYGLRELALLPTFSTRGALRPASLAAMAQAVRQSGTRVVFAEKTPPSKTLRRISRSSGIPISPKPLMADGLAPGMTTVQTATTNICTIVDGQGGRCDRAGAERLDRRWAAIP